jgi:hypothetical protein
MIISINFFESTLMMTQQQRQMSLLIIFFMDVKDLELKLIVVVDGISSAST